MEQVVHRRQSRRPARSLILFGSTAAVTTLLVHSILTRGQNIEERAGALSTSQGILIAFGEPSQFAVPPDTDKKIFPEDMRADSADREHVAAALDGLERAFASYPSGFVSKLIRAVFICGALHAGNARAWGTFDPNWILIAAPSDRSVEDVREKVAATFHHELSSAVLRQPGAIDRWSRYWPRGQEEVHQYNDLTARANDKVPDPSSGFLSAYALTNPENDFNVYAEYVFTDPQRMKSLSARYDIVAKKMRLLAELYAAVDSRIESALLNTARH